MLQASGFDRFGRITYVCNPDEEIGSPFSGPVIRELAPQHDAAFVLEAARANGDIVSARNGITDYAVDDQGARRARGRGTGEGAQARWSRPPTRSSRCRRSTAGGPASP